MGLVFERLEESEIYGIFYISYN